MNEGHELMAAVVANPAAVDWFRGLFRRAHVEIQDTGQQFTIVHEGDTGVLIEGFAGDAPNFVVPADMAALRRLVAVFDDGSVDAEEEYRIVRAMLRPCLQAALEMPVLNKAAVRAALQMDDHWQEVLVDPDGHEQEPLTAIRENGRWTVLEGLHGEPQRRLRLTPADALEFQRRLFAADEADSMTAWLALATWYVRWRDEVTVSRFDSE